MPRAHAGRTSHAAEAAKTSNTASPRPTEDLIRCRAYEKFCKRGAAAGDPISDWLEAERELADAGVASAKQQ